METTETQAHDGPEDGKGTVAALRRLVELALAHPDIGPPLADLAYAINYKDIGDQLVRLGTERENPRVEYFVIAGYAARRGKRFADVFANTLKAVKVFSEQGGDPEEGDRVLQLVRTAMAVLMFDLKDLGKEPEFTAGLADLLPALEDRLGGNVHYRMLLAQSLWFKDKDASDREWERAREISVALEGAPGLEMVWNARGTWAKEADRDLDKAERLYRRGLDAAPDSALLLHNLAQVLVERAEHAAPSPGAARHLLNQASDLLRRTLKADIPRLRRHIYATRDRLEQIRRSLPASEPPAPRAQSGYGHSHSHSQAQAPAQAQAQAQAQAPAPAPVPASAPAPQQVQAAPAPQASPPPPRRDNRPPPRPQQQNRGNQAPQPPRDPGQAFLRTGTVSLGDMLKAKLAGPKKDEKDEKGKAKT